MWDEICLNGTEWIHKDKQRHTTDGWLERNIDRNKGERGNILLLMIEGLGGDCLGEETD